jgi:hypothetical protein
MTINQEANALIIGTVQGKAPGHTGIIKNEMAQGLIPPRKASAVMDPRVQRIEAPGPHPDFRIVMAQGRNINLEVKGLIIETVQGKVPGRMGISRNEKVQGRIPHRVASAAAYIRVQKTEVPGPLQDFLSVTVQGQSTNLEANALLAEAVQEKAVNRMGIFINGKAESPALRSMEKEYTQNKDIRKYNIGERP